jgi:hypothetical protein
VTVDDIGRYIGEYTWIARERRGRDIGRIKLGKLEDRNANEEIPGRLAQQKEIRNASGKIIVGVSSETSDSFAWTSKKSREGGGEGHQGK